MSTATMVSGYFRFIWNGSSPMSRTVLSLSATMNPFDFRL